MEVIPLANGIAALFSTTSQPAGLEAAPLDPGRHRLAALLEQPRRRPRQTSSRASSKSFCADAVDAGHVIADLESPCDAF